MLGIKSKRGEIPLGLIAGIVFGIASLVVVVIISFTIVSTLNSANIIGSDELTTIAVSNETAGYLNQTGYNVSVINASTSGYTLTTLWTTNATGHYVTSVPLSNGTLSAAGLLRNATTTEYTNISASYTYVYTHDNTFEVSAAGMSSDFVSGVDNVSSKIPTVLLVAAIVLILGVLVLLVGAWQRMRMGGGGI